MSIKLENATFKNEKNSLNFSLEKGNNAFIICENNKELVKLSNFLKGKNNLINGKFLIDNEYVLSKRWINKKVIWITNKNNLFMKVLPIKITMFLSLIFNPKFYSQAKMKYIENKFSYLSYAGSKGIENEIELRNKIDVLLNRFTNNSLKVEEEWISEFSDQISNFDLKKLESSYPNIEDHIKYLILNHCKMIEDNRNNEILITFLQSLYDKVYSITELRSSCDCEYDIKRKKLKLKKKLFYFTEQNYIVKKQLKIIDLKISILKRKIRKTKYQIWNSEKQLKMEISKSDAFESISNRSLNSIINWKQLVDDQRHEFIKKQEKMIFFGLKDESKVLRGKIVELVHSLHLKIFNKDLSLIEKSVFKNKSNELKREIVPVFSQVTNWTSDSLEKLGVQIKFNKNKIFGSQLNFIYIKMLQAIFKNKSNLIFENVLNNLTKANSEELIKAIENFQQINENVSMLFLDNSFRNILNFQKKVYSYEFKKINQIDFSSKYISSIYDTHNKLYFDKNSNTILIKGQQIKWNLENIDNKKNLVANFLSINTNRKNATKSSIEFAVKIKNNNFKDPNIYEGITKYGEKFYFYNENKIYEKQISIFIDEKDIIKF